MAAPASTPESGSRLGRLTRLFVRAVDNFYRDSGLDLAAAVAFYSLLSLPPLLYLVGSVLGWVFADSTAVDAALASTGSFVPEEVAAWLSRFNLGLSTEGGVVLLALPALLWAANRGFTALGRALNVAFGIRRRRANWQARAQGFALMGAALLFLTASLLAASVMPRVNTALEGLGLPHLPLVIQSGLATILAPLVSLVTFTLFYRLLPYTVVGWRPAMAGAVLAWLLWEGARRLFGRLLRASQAFGLVSGTVAGMLTLLLWIYTGVAILLLGAELAAVLNGRPAAVPPRRKPSG